MPAVNELSPAALADPEAKAALLWVLGAFGSHPALPGAPYALEALAEGFSGEEPGVRLAALTAGARLFFARPPEARPALGKLLAAGVADAHPDVRDRALLYHRLLRADAGAARAVLGEPLPPLASFAEELSPEQREQARAPWRWVGGGAPPLRLRFACRGGRPQRGALRGCRKCPP